MERETKTVSTPLEKELVLKSRLNAGERNQYIAALRECGYDGQDLSDFAAGIMALQSAERVFKVVVVSYDGSSENVYQRLEELPADEFDFVLRESGQVAQGNFQKAN